MRVVVHPALRSTALTAAAAVAVMVTTASSLLATPRIVVVGEIAGAANAAAELLQHLEVIDSDGHWIAGDTILVQTGDLLDGGENVHAALDLFMQIEGEAAAAGGQVVVLLGNHEILNMLGDLSQVNYMAFQHFTGEDSDLQQQRAWEAWAAWRQQRADALGEEFDPEGIRDEWFALHPPGWVEYAMSMRPEGVYGRWLRGRPAAFAIDGVVFVHAGLTAQVQGQTVDEINQRIAEEIARFDDYRAQLAADGLCLPFSSVREMVDVVGAEIAFINGRPGDRNRRVRARAAAAEEVQDLTKIGSWTILSEEGPLWFRGVTAWDEASRAAEMAAVLDAGGFERMVIGHVTGADKHIHTCWGHRVVIASTELSDDPWVSDAPGAIEIVDGDFHLISPAGRQLMIDGGLSRTASAAAGDPAGD